MTRHSTLRRHLPIVALVLTLVPLAAMAEEKIAYEEALLTQRVEAAYLNPWYTADPAPPLTEPTSTAFYGGGAACVPPACPHPTTCLDPPDCTNLQHDFSIQLATVSFGQPFAVTVPFASSPICDTSRGQTDCGFVGDAVWRAGEMLYHSRAHSTGTCAEQTPVEDHDAGVYCQAFAAFRYKDLLYETYDRPDGDACCGGGGCCSPPDPEDTPACCSWPADVPGPVNQIEARLSTMADFFGGTYGSEPGAGTGERGRSQEAERILRNALKYDPSNRQLRNALLDVYYDRAVAEVAYAKEKLVDVARARIEPPPPGGFVISNEIAAYEDILGTPDTPGGYRFALEGYFELLRDPLGVDVAAVDPSVTDDRPFGFHVFQEEVPSRSLYAASYLNGGVPTPVLDEDEDGEPDELFSGFKDLAMLFDVLGDYGDASVQLAKLYVMRSQGTDIDDALSLIAEAQEKLYLEGTILLNAFPGGIPGPGSASGVAEAVNEWRHQMTELQRVRDFIRGDANILGFSDDFLMLVQDYVAKDPFNEATYDNLLGWMQGTPTAPLTWARTKYDEARGSYDSYKGQQDQLATQFSDRSGPYTERLRKIVGVEPGQSGYETPELNEGSEIWLQIQSIGVAQNRITMNDVRMLNLLEQIEIEVDRRGKEKGIQNAMSQMYIDYGNKQAHLTEEISYISAAMAFANSAQDATKNIVSSLGTSLFSAPANAVIQAAGEIAKGQLSAQKERLAAEERAKINDMQSQILDVNSEAQIKTWWLQARVIEIESLEAVLLLGQEIGRLKALYDEKAAIERNMASENELLAGRYFADPIHLLRMQADMIEADDAFDEAQKWTFFLARALEYKWNHEFAHSHGGRSWTRGSLYGLRNAEELQAMVAAMQDYDQSLMSTVRDDNQSWFSVRDDFFGYKYLVDGQVKLYEDPDTGELVDGIEAFRRELTRRMDEDGYITLDFSTVREIPGGNFFLGPRYNASGALISAGTWLDKIEWMKINLPGAHTTGQTMLTGFMRYGGVSYVRTQDMGTIPDPQRPDLVEGEMTAWPSRYWYFHQASDAWRYNEGLSAPVQMQLSYNPGQEPTVAQIAVFKERSVATTGWQLVIPTLDPTPVLNIDELNDIEILFYHWYAVRPMPKDAAEPAP